MKATIIILCALATTTWASEYLVHPDGTGEYPSIADALSAAPPGAQITLIDGVFTGSGNSGILVQQNVTIVSQSGNPQNCVIDGSNGDGFVLDCSSFCMRGITLRNCSRGLYGAPLDAAATDVKVHNCILENHSVIAIFVDRSLLLTQSTLRGNTNSGIGGHDCTGDITIIDSDFYNSYGTIGYSGGGTIVVEGCNISGNHGGISIFGNGECPGSLAVIKNTTVMNNYGGVYLNVDRSGYLFNCTLRDNQSADLVLRADEGPDFYRVDCCDIGAMDISDSSPHVIDNEDCTVTSEKLSWSRVKAIYR